MLFAVVAAFLAVFAKKVVFQLKNLRNSAA
jgi:hypothetical protein